MVDCSRSAHFIVSVIGCQGSCRCDWRRVGSDKATAITCWPILGYDCRCHRPCCGCVCVWKEFGMGIYSCPWNDLLYLDSILIIQSLLTSNSCLGFGRYNQSRGREKMPHSIPMGESKKCRTVTRDLCALFFLARPICHDIERPWNKGIEDWVDRILNIGIWFPISYSCISCSYWANWFIADDCTFC